MIEQELVSINKNKEEFYKPITTKWKDVEIIRLQTPKTAIHQIVQHMKRLDYVKLGIIGEPHTGKTTLAKFIAHFLHLMALGELGINYQVKIFGREELLNFKRTMNNLPTANYILIFDDISFLEQEATPEQLSEIKAGETMIRHFKDKQDVKIVQIDNYHYTKGHNKYLRQSHFKFFTGVGSSEGDNINAITKGRSNFTIEKFEKLQSEMYSTGKFSFTIGRNKRPFIYQYRDPFIPVLFWDSSNLRFIVTPTREWMDRACSICATAEGSHDEDFNLDSFKQALIDRYTEPIAKNAVKIKMREMGLNTYRPELSRAVDNISKMMSEKNFDILQLGLKFDLKLTKQVRRHEFDKLFESATEKEPKTVNTEIPSNNHIGKQIPWKDANNMSK